MQQIPSAKNSFKLFVFELVLRTKIKDCTLNTVYTNVKSNRRKEKKSERKLKEHVALCKKIKKQNCHVIRLAACPEAISREGLIHWSILRLRLPSLIIPLKSTFEETNAAEDVFTT